MFGIRKRGPDRPPFSHTDDCPILRADSSVQIEWSEEEAGHFVRRCVCTEEHYREPARARVRLDPLDPKTSHHAPQCEFASETERSVLKVLLRVQEGVGGGYWWTTCNACEVSWQVPYFAEERVGLR